VRNLGASYSGKQAKGRVETKLLVKELTNIIGRKNKMLHDHVIFILAVDIRQGRRLRKKASCFIVN
jgi:hypothetical protein